VTAAGTTRRTEAGRLKSLLHAVIATLVYIVLSNVASFAVLRAGIALHIDVNRVSFALLASISESVVLGAVVMWLWARRRAAAVVPSRATGWHYLAAILLGFGFVFARWPIRWLYAQLAAAFHPSAPPVPNPAVSGVDLSGLLDLLTVSVVVLYPITEELFFRSGIQRSLERSMSNVIAVMFSAALFATIHLPYECLFFPDCGGSGQLAFHAFFGGLISAVLFSRSRSVGPSIVFHATWNATACVLH
jgi:membrane protease YdiL (CAAX protease family)